MDGAPIIGGLAGIASGILNASASGSTSAEARRQFEQNLKFQRYQYEDMKQYQSYKNQVRMMREGGLNPALMFGSGAQPQTLSSVGGVAPTASFSTPDYSGIPSSAAAFGNMISQSDVNKSAVEVNNTVAAKNIHESIGQAIKNLYEHGNQQLAQTYQRYLNGITEKEMQYQTLTLDDRIQQQQFKTLQEIANFELGQITLKHADQRQTQEISLMMANEALAYANQEKSLKEAHESFMRTIRNYGLSEQEAHELWKLSFDYILEQGDTERSTQYKNWLTPPITVGGSGFAHEQGSFNAGSAAGRSRNRRGYKYSNYPSKK